MKTRKSTTLEWKVSEEDLRKKTAGEEVYFRSLFSHPDEEGGSKEEPRDEQELMENIFDRDLES